MLRKVIINEPPGLSKRVGGIVKRKMNETYFISLNGKMHINRYLYMQSLEANFQA